MEGGAMEWLNYHHLLYFWVVACHGSVTRAAAELRLAQSTVSTQLRTLEEVLGEKLFARTGRRLVLTDVGRPALHRLEQFSSETEDLVGVAKDQPAHVGEHEPPSGAREELLAEHLLERAQLGADR